MLDHCQQHFALHNMYYSTIFRVVHHMRYQEELEYLHSCCTEVEIKIKYKDSKKELECQLLVGVLYSKYVDTLKVFVEVK